MKTLLGGFAIASLFLLTWLLLSSSEATPAVATPQQGPPVSSEPTPPRGQYVGALNLDGPFDFAGDTLDTDNFDVRERLDLELMRNTFFHRNTLLLLKRRSRYFPVMERILREEGVPEDLKYLAAAESGLANVRSPAGARGVWQFMAPTARSYGLEVTGEVDERLHLEKATRAAAAYLRDYYREFGDWHKVAAAYNIGGPNLKKWLGKQQAERLEDLDINQETMQYLYRIVALKSILRDPEAYGYYVDAAQEYPPLDKFRTVSVGKSIPDLAAFARREGTTYRMLKLYNPWLVAGNLPVRGGKTYELRLPAA